MRRTRTGANIGSRCCTWRNKEEAGPRGVTNTVEKSFREEME